MRLPVDEVIPYCELCGAWAEFTAVPLWPESGSLPPPDLASVALCGSCLADGVPPGWHTMPLPVAGKAESAMPTPQTEDLPRTYRWNLWKRPDGTNFLSWGQPRDPVEHEQLVRTFESENWQTAAQEAFGSAPEIDTALRPLVGVLHHFPSVLVATARLDHTEHGQRLAVIGLTIDSVWCLRRLLCSLTAASPQQSKTAWELLVDADDGWLRTLPPNGMALTLKIHLRDAAPVSLADFADDLSAQTPWPK